MRWATYWRHVNACPKADGQTLRFLVADAEKLLGRRITLNHGAASCEIATARLVDCWPSVQASAVSQASHAEKQECWRQYV